MHCWLKCTCIADWKSHLCIPVLHEVLIGLSIGKMTPQRFGLRSTWTCHLDWRCYCCRFLWIVNILLLFTVFVTCYSCCCQHVTWWMLIAIFNFYSCRMFQSWQPHMNLARPEVPEMQLGGGKTTSNATGPAMKGKLRCAGVVACNWLLPCWQFQWSCDKVSIHLNVCSLGSHEDAKYLQIITAV